MTEQRMFNRIKFLAKTTIQLDKTSHEAQLVDISLKGALISPLEPFNIHEGALCNLTVHLNDSDIALQFKSEVIHVRDNSVGLKFIKLDIDTMIHLRSLMELNTADPELVKSELQHLTR